MTADLADLLQRVRAATGHDPGLDRELAEALDGSAATAASAKVPDLTASVDRCLALLHRQLPGWHWHVGWDAGGVLPYAFVTDAARHRFEAAAATVPLALLDVILQARIALAAADGDTAADADRR